MIVGNSFYIILNHAIFVSKDSRRINCSRAEQEASVFLQKNTLSSYTLYNIFNPPPNLIFPAMTEGSVFHDFASAHVIVRAMFEAYVNMYYLIIDPSSNEEKEFRLDIWERHALTERQKMGFSIGSTNQILIEEKQQIEERANSILTSDYYKRLPKSEQQSIKDSPKWTKINVLERADKANIHRSQSEFLYKFMSNYSHSESFSIMQLHDIEKPEDALNLCKTPIRYGEMFLALTLNIFSTLNSKFKESVFKNKDVEKLINFWEETKQRDIKKVLGKVS